MKGTSSGRVARSLAAPLAAAALHALVLFAVALLRPVRDAMGVAAGVGRLPWLFTATLALLVVVTLVHGFAARRLPRARLVPAVWLAIAGLLLLFFVLFRALPESKSLAAAFFVAVAATNLVAVSSFWSELADRAAAPTAKRSFGPVAAGGSLGALGGPAFAAFAGERLGAPALLLVAATALALAALGVRRHGIDERHPADERATPIGGTLALGPRLALRSPALRSLALLVASYATITTLLYLAQSAAVEREIAATDARVAWFARVDLVVNAVALVAQLGLAPFVALRFGAVPLLATGFVLLGTALPLLALSPSLVVVSALYALHRSAGFALLRPGRELVATRLAVAERFQGKAFVDSAVYRTSDALAAWLVAALASFGAAVAPAVVTLLALAAALVGARLGRRFENDSLTQLAPLSVPSPRPTATEPP